MCVNTFDNLSHVWTKHSYKNFVGKRTTKLEATDDPGYIGIMIGKGIN